jgi:hypothetical protein
MNFDFIYLTFSGRHPFEERDLVIFKQSFNNVFPWLVVNLITAEKALNILTYG